jgi:hypothetical protein
VPVNTNSGDANSFPFRAVLGFEGSPPSNVFNLNCAAWTTVDALNYGGVPLDLFVFQVDGDGVVTGLSLPGFANYAWKGRLMSISSNIHSVGFPSTSRTAYVCSFLSIFLSSCRIMALPDALFKYRQTFKLFWYLIFTQSLRYTIIRRSTVN